MQRSIVPGLPGPARYGRQGPGGRGPRRVALCVIWSLGETVAGGTTVEEVVIPNWFSGERCQAKVGQRHLDFLVEAHVVLDAPHPPNKGSWGSIRNRLGTRPCLSSRTLFRRVVLRAADPECAPPIRLTSRLNLFPTFTKDEDQVSWQTLPVN